MNTLTKFLKIVLDNKDKIDNDFNKKNLGTFVKRYSPTFNKLAGKIITLKEDQEPSARVLKRITEHHASSIGKANSKLLNVVINLISSPIDYERNTIAIRKIMRVEGVENDAVINIIYPRNLKEEKMAEQKEYLTDNLMNVKVVPASNLNKLIRTAKGSTTGKRDKAYVLALLQLGSGVRFNELYTSTFEKTADNKILQSNISKQKNVEPIERQILFLSADEWLDRLEKIRKTTEMGHDTAYYSNSFSRPVNRLLTKLFGDFTMTTHKLRKLYATILYDMMGDDQKKRYNKVAFINVVLGHGSFDSSLYYDININYDEPLEGLDA